MIPMLQRLLDPAAAREFLTSSLPSLCDGAYELGSLDVVQTYLREDWIVQYSVDIRDRTSGNTQARLLSVQSFPNRDVAKASAKIAQQLRKAGRDAPMLAGFILESHESQFLIFPFPLDSKIKRLPKGFSRKSVWKRLRKEPIQIRVLRYVPGRRCQFLYEFPECELLAKMFRDQRGETLFRSMMQISAEFDRNGDQSLTAPRALDYLPDWQLLIQEKAPGQTLYELIRGGVATDRHIESAAQSIAVLHSAQLRPGESYRIADEIHLIDWSLRSLDTVGFSDSRFGEVLNRLREFGENLRPSPSRAVHRDFYDKQLLMHGRRAALIDFDTLALSCAEIDLANFLAHLQLRLLEAPGAPIDPDHWGSIFLRAYEDRASSRPDESLLRFFMATTYFRLACKSRLRPDRGDVLALRLLLLATQAIQCVSNTVGSN